MCSVGEDVFDNDGRKSMEKPNIKLSDVCNKCRTNKPIVVLRSKDVYCKDCFLTGTVHKFKASLGKSKLIQCNDQVLVWHQIGHPSTALLHFLKTGLELSAPKRLRFQPLVLFIDDQYHLSLDERLQLLKEAKEKNSGFGFKPHFISFVDYITYPQKVSELVNTEYTIVSENEAEKVDLVINKQTSKTNRTDIKNLLSRQLLLDVAKHYKCKFIFSPWISADIAVGILSNVSLGRGTHISIDTGFCDDRDTDVKILRPLRLFDMKEIVFYNNLNNLEPLYVRQNESNVYSSVQDLMKKFVADLQASYPATVTTILKTGDKLSVNKSGQKTCQLCKGALPFVGEQISSHLSTRFSHLVSNELLDYNISRQDRFKKILEKFDKEDITHDSLCYACSNIYKNINIIDDK